MATRPENAEAKARLRAELDRRLKATGDPRALNPDDDRWDRFRYYGAPAR